MHITERRFDRAWREAAVMMEERGKERRGENAALPYSVARSLACHVGFTGSSAQLNGLSYITSSQRGNRVKKRIDKQTSSTRNGPYLGKKWHTFSLRYCFGAWGAIS